MFNACLMNQKIMVHAKKWDEVVRLDLSVTGTNFVFGHVSSINCLDQIKYTSFLVRAMTEGGMGHHPEAADQLEILGQAYAALAEGKLKKLFEFKFCSLSSCFGNHSVNIL